MKTNYERIKEMTIEEMAEHYLDFESVINTIIPILGHYTYDDIKSRWREWLESEADKG